VVPLEFRDGETRSSLGLTGFERYDIEGLSDSLSPRAQLTVVATAPDGSVKRFQARCRIDTPEEVTYYKNGGILQYVLRQLVK
jgi:aconitate hydratase